VKKRIDVDDCLISENSVDEATQTVNELHCFCDPSAVGCRAVYYLYLVCVFAVHCSLVFERPRVACRFEFCTVTIAFKVSRLVARSVTKELVKDNMGNHGKVREKDCTLPMQPLLQQRRIDNDLLATCECETLF